MIGANVLIADDDEVSARLVTRLLSKEGCRIRVVKTREAALLACSEEPPDLVLIDLLAPRGHGFDVCRQLKSQAATRLIPVVIATARSERRDRLTSIEAGCDDFIVKPYDQAELRARIRSLVRLKRYTDELETAETVMLGLGATIEARDPCTRGHCQRLAGYATVLGKSLGLDESDLAALDRGGFLHDIGKIAVPDSILLKGGALNAQESRVMREHPIIGDALCAGLRSFSKVRPIVRHHHERLDGSGYPDGLRNREVPLLAQIVGIVDVFDALTSERPYRAARTREEAFQALTEEATKGWRDRALVDAFVAVTADVTADPGEVQMAKYGKKASEKVEKAMHERKHGTLRSGGSGKKVKSRKQAIAIGLSEARRAGGKVPRKRSGGRKRKAAGRKK